MNVFDVRVYGIRRRAGRRRPFEVRWHAAGRAWSRSFTTRARWPTVTAPSWSGPRARAWRSARPLASRCCGAFHRFRVSRGISMRWRLWT